MRIWHHCTQRSVPRETGGTNVSTDTVSTRDVKPREAQVRPGCWAFRWWDIDSSGKRVRRTKTLDTVREYPTETSAMKAVEAYASPLTKSSRKRQISRLRWMLSLLTLSNTNSVRSKRTRKNRKVAPMLLGRPTPTSSILTFFRSGATSRCVKCEPPRWRSGFVS